MAQKQLTTQEKVQLLFLEGEKELAGARFHVTVASLQLEAMEFALSLPRRKQLKSPN